MKITITITTDNAAFEESPHHEVARILQSIAARGASDGTQRLPGNTGRPASWAVIDLNGLTCGRVEVTP